MTVYFRPLISDDPVRPPEALRIAGGWTWATHAERIERSEQGRTMGVIPIGEVPDGIRRAMGSARADFAGISLSAPRIMGILNTTPDSFSDGGQHAALGAALARARAMWNEGADVIDVGGESTRPGAATVESAEEISRVEPVVQALAVEGPVSIDTRKASVARAALDVGASIVNDVSALGFDRQMARVVADAKAPVVLMHAQGTPETMQAAPSYGDVLLDVYDDLALHIARAEDAGIPRTRIMVDPGIGFGKTLDHNRALLTGISMLHGLGCPILLGASRKRFIGTLSGVDASADRVSGSVAVAQAAVAQGVQMVRVHDTLATKQALTLWQAARGQ
ncbi:MAG: dihydropteroate synthase [Pseudomonadota bacterium]